MRQTTIRPRVWAAARMGLAAGVLAVVLGRADPGRAAAEVARAPAWAFVVPVGLLLCNSLLHAIRMLLLAPVPPRPGAERPPLRTFLRIVLLGNFVGIFLPTGGADAAKIVALAPYAGGWDRALAVQGTARLMELLPWGLLLVWGACGVLPGRLPELVPLAVAAALGFAGTLALALGYLRGGHRLTARLPEAVATRLRRSTVLDVAPAPFLLCLLLTLPFALINGVIVWAILIAYGHPVPLRDVLGVIPAADVLISLPITISGLGIREGLFVHCLAAWSVPAPVALAVAFTRWTGELGRAALGGIAFGLAQDRRGDVTPPDGERR